jgi:hypothetical protein
MVSNVDCLRCDNCGIEIPVAAIVGLDGAEAMSADEYLDRLHAAGFELFCEVCIVGREVAWQMTPWQPPGALPRFAVKGG